MIKQIIILSVLILVSYKINSAGEDIYKQWLTAAEKGDLNKIKELKDRVDINHQDKEGHNALMFAATRGREDVVKYLLDNGFSEINAKDQYKRTALMYAIYSGNENIIKLLLQKAGIDVNAQNVDLNTALNWAINSKNKNIVKLLLTAGADPNIKNKSGKTIIDQASSEFKPVFETLIGQVKLEQEWFEAAFNGNLETLQRLSSKIDVNIQDNDGRTALIAATYALMVSEKIIKYLLSLPGINVNLQDASGHTALMGAIYDEESLVRLFLQVPGIDVNLKNQHGETALILAVSRENKNIVKLLLAMPEINVNATTNLGTTALKAAIGRNREDNVKLLLQAAGININALDNYGRTALFDAVINEQENIIKLLLDAAVDQSIKDKSGKTFIDVAKPEFKPTLEKIINETKRENPRLLSALAIELSSLSNP